jgi:hypothetical protein
MLRRIAVIAALALGTAGAAHGATFVNPVVALRGTGTSCTQLLDPAQRLPAVAGNASGRAMVAALAPDCSVTVALRSAGTAFAPARVVGGQAAAGTETIDAPRALVNARGDAVVSWLTPQGCTIAYAPAGSDTVGAAEAPPLPEDAPCALALDGTGRVTLPRGGGIVDRAAGGAVGPAAALPPGAHVVALAANEAGDTVAVVESPAGPGLRALQIAIRPSGSTWGPFAPLATATTYNPFRSVRDVSLAVDAAGRITAVWPDSVANTLPISLGPTGVLMSATGTVAGGMGSAAPLPAPGRVVLESRRGYLFAASARGDVAVAFAAITGPLTGAFVLTERSAGSPFGSPTALGTVRVTKLLGAYSRFAAATVPIAVALAADGSLEVVQGIEDVGVSFLQARVRPLGGAFGRPFWLTTPLGTGRLIRGATEVAASSGPAGGSPLVAWRGEGSGLSAILTSPVAAPAPVAALGGPPPVAFRVVRVRALRHFNGSRYLPGLRITVRTSRPTVGQVVVKGAADPLSIPRAGVSTVEDSLFAGRVGRSFHPGQRVRLVIDFAGAGAAQAVRTITLPR